MDFNDSKTKQNITAIDANGLQEERKAQSVDFNDSKTKQQNRTTIDVPSYKKKERHKVCAFVPHEGSDSGAAC